MKIDRHSAIREHLYRHGPTGIADLAHVTDASEATIRRDLQLLERAGEITRTHGGARIANATTIEVAFRVRETQNIAAKRAIAAAVAPMIAPNSSVFLDAGTTVLQVARHLRLNSIPIAAFTNGLMVALELLNLPKLNVTLLGGHLRNENASCVGPLAEAMLSSIWMDLLLLGAGAVSRDGRIYTADADEARLNARMLERASRVVILADSTKFGRTSTFVVSSIPPGSTVVTDRGITSDWRTRLADLGTNVLIAKTRERQDEAETD
jgi:DeoR/GlpR family transcriptional regulator of sugar metabolism